LSECVQGLAPKKPRITSERPRGDLEKPSILWSGVDACGAGRPVWHRICVPGKVVSMQRARRARREDWGNGRQRTATEKRGVPPTAKRERHAPGPEGIQRRTGTSWAAKCERHPPASRGPTANRDGAGGDARRKRQVAGKRHSTRHAQVNGKRRASPPAKRERHGARGKRTGPCTLPSSARQWWSADGQGERTGDAANAVGRMGRDGGRLRGAPGGVRRARRA